MNWTDADLLRSRHEDFLREAELDRLARDSAPRRAVDLEGLKSAAPRAFLVVIALAYAVLALR
jgi:hypothetical protein